MHPKLRNVTSAVTRAMSMTSHLRNRAVAESIKLRLKDASWMTTYNYAQVADYCDSLPLEADLTKVDCTVLGSIAKNCRRAHDAACELNSILKNAT